jgi:hypothetical protein
MNNWKNALYVHSPSVTLFVRISVRLFPNAHTPMFVSFYDPLFGNYFTPFSPSIVFHMNPHLGARYRIRGAVPPLPHTFSWRGALFKYRIRLHGVVLSCCIGYVFMVWCLVKVQDTSSWRGA